VSFVENAVPAAPPYAQKKAEPKTLRVDKYMRKEIPKGEADLFWLDRMMNCKLDVTVGDVYLYSEGATKAMYKRLPNDDTTRKALEAYRARRLQQQPASTNVVIANATDEEEPTEESEDEAEEVVASINHVQISDIH
jgi:hypothetical protein